MTRKIETGCMALIRGTTDIVEVGTKHRATPPLFELWQGSVYMGTAQASELKRLTNDEVASFRNQQDITLTNLLF